MTLDRDEVSDVSRELTIELFEPGADVEMVDRSPATFVWSSWSSTSTPSRLSPLGPAPGGSKGVELVAIGALLVHVTDSVPVVNAVVTSVRQWLARTAWSGRSLKITVEGRTLELSAATAEQQQQLVAEFVRSLSDPHGST